MITVCGEVQDVVVLLRSIRSSHIKFTLFIIQFTALSETATKRLDVKDDQSFEVTLVSFLEKDSC
jgi:hypothetical protein